MVARGFKDGLPNFVQREKTFPNTLRGVLKYHSHCIVVPQQSIDVQLGKPYKEAGEEGGVGIVSAPRIRFLV